MKVQLKCLGEVDTSSVFEVDAYFGNDIIAKVVINVEGEHQVTIQNLFNIPHFLLASIALAASTLVDTLFTDEEPQYEIEI